MRRALSILVTSLMLALPAQTPASAAFSVDLAPRADTTLIQARFRGGGHRMGGHRFGGHRFGGHRFGGHRFGERHGASGGRRFGGFRGGYGRRGYGGGYRYGRRGYGAGVAGLAAGALIGTAIAAGTAASYSGTVASCERRFRSYNPATRTYTGYDGLQHRCP